MRKIHILALCSLLLLAGCKDPASLGVGRLPYPDYVAEIKIEDNDKPALLDFRARYPDQFERVQAIHKQYVALHAERRAWLEKAVDINFKQLIEVGRYEKPEATAAISAQLKLHGYPADDPIYQKVK